MPLPSQQSLTPHQHACLYRQRTPSKSHNASLLSRYRISLLKSYFTLFGFSHSDIIISFLFRQDLISQPTWHGWPMLLKSDFINSYHCPKTRETIYQDFGYIRKVIFSTKTKACLSLKGWTRRQRAFCSHKVRDDKLSHYAEKRVDQNQTLPGRGWPVPALSIYQCWSNALKTGRWKTNFPLQGEKEPS